MYNRFPQYQRVTLKTCHMGYLRGLIVYFFTVYFYCWMATFAIAASSGSADVVTNKSDKVRFYLGLEKRVLQGKDIKDVQSATNIWLTWAGEDFDIEAKTIFYDDTELMSNDLVNGKLDLIAITSLNYLRYINHISRDLELGPVGTYNGNTLVKYLLVSKKNLNFTSISDLKGKSLVLQKLNDIERLYINTLLLRAGLDVAENFFGKISEKLKPARAVLDVFFGRADICVVPEHVFRTMSELNPQIGRMTKVLATSPDLIPGVTCFRKNGSHQIKQLIKNMAPKIKNTERGKQMLMMYKIDGLSQIREKDLDQLKTIASEYEALKTQTAIK